MRKSGDVEVEVRQGGKLEVVLIFADFWAD